MSEQEQRMLAYASLAEESRLKGQQNGYLRFVLLAGIAACRSGWSSISSRCHELVLKANPRHILSNFGSLEEALRSNEFQAYLHHLERFCTFERAEHLLEQLEFDWNSEGDNFELESTVLKRLEKID